MTVAIVAVVVIGLGGWALLTMRAAQNHLLAARAALSDARGSLQAKDSATALAAIATARAEASAAADLAGSPIWSASAAVPLLGDTPRAARLLALAADEALGAVAHIADASEGLDPAALVGENRRLNLMTLARITAAAGDAQEPLTRAHDLVAQMPSAAAGAWVLPPVETARTQFADLIGTLVGAVDAAAEFGTIGPAVLGADGPRTYFVAVQAANETRGTGGMVGTWGVLRADQGQLTVVEVGSNGDLPDLDEVPASLGAEYLDRYGVDPQLVVNMNISPDLPSAAALWLASWRNRTGQVLDGAISIDVAAVGDLLAAAGTTLTAPDGQTITGEQFADFALRGVYEKFPTSGDSGPRKAYQEALARQALAAVLQLPNPVALGQTVFESVDQRRIGLWVADPDVQAAIAGTALAHELPGAPPHTVEPVIINVGWSKLDTYIDRTFTYAVGRCPSGSGSVRSELTMQLTSDLPDAQLPPYVVGTVRRSPAGPVNRVLLQAHLPEGAQVFQVLVDGKPSPYSPFTEGGRPAVLATFDLPPGQVREMRVDFTEPASGRPGEVLVQPMARDATVTVADQPC